jgi:hypothetical protein
MRGRIVWAWLYFIGGRVRKRGIVGGGVALGVKQGMRKMLVKMRGSSS